MNKLDFNEREFTNADQRDIMRFTSMVISDERFKNNGTIFANSLTEKDDTETNTMKTVEIRFQFFRPKDKGKGSSFIWTSYRAKSHTCSNTYIKEII